MSAKAKHFDQFYAERIKAAEKSEEPMHMKHRQRKERIKVDKIEVQIDLNREEATSGADKLVKHRFDLVTQDKSTQTFQLTTKQKAKVASSFKDLTSKIPTEGAQADNFQAILKT